MAKKCPKCNFENPDDSKFCKECGTQIIPKEEISVSPTETLETPKEELTTGSVFAERYQIIEVLGKGGMGKVYRALDKKLNEEVALKLIKPEIASDKKTLERFSNELKIARKIAHKNVGRMYELMEEKGTHFITMEYVPGQDLKGLIRQSGQLAPGTTINIAKQVCEGLTEAHGLGVIHRDLKPQNIMIDKEGNSRIMDFGIARSLKAKGITGAGVMIGTPEYMSPEQVEAKEADQRSDIYSLGVILYEMVTGRVPFEGDTPLSVAVKQKTETPEDPRKLNSQIPGDLSSVILKCMEKNKEKRYQSAGEVHSELDKIEKGIPTTERIVPKRKPITSREITVTFGLKKLFIPALVIAALVIAAVIVWQVPREKKAVPIPSETPSLAIVYFENVTGDESLEGWRMGLSDLLITDLMQSKFINVLPQDRIFSILQKLNLLEVKRYSTEDLVKVANEGGVNHTVTGSLMRTGENIIITWRLQKPHTNEIIRSEKIECKGEKEIYPRVDELTRQIKLDLDLSREQIASDIDREVGKITTRSPLAYMYYIEGRKYHNLGNWNKSIEYMNKALKEDPKLAIAYRNIGLNYTNQGLTSEGLKYMQKALELSDHLSDREKYHIQASLFILSEDTYSKVLEADTKLLRLYPTDTDGNNNLGVLYLRLEECDKSIERFEIIKQNKGTDVGYYTNQSRAYSAKGLYSKAIEVLEYYLNNIADSAHLRYFLALNYLIQRKYDLALIEIDNALSFNPNDILVIKTKGDIYLCQGDLISSKREYEKLITLGEAASMHGKARLGNLNLLQGMYEEAKKQFRHSIKLEEKMGWKVHIYEPWKRLFLIYSYLQAGNAEGALEECKVALKSAAEARDMRVVREALFLKGFAYIDMNSTKSAQKTASELKKLIEEAMNKKLIRLYYHLIGMIELKREDYSEATEYLEKAVSLLPYQRTYDYNFQALFLNSLAFTYYKSGNLEMALEVYEKITSLTSGRIMFNDIYAKSFYMLGRVYEQQGNKSKAIEHYEKFLELWKDGDPGIDEVEDAKKRLAGLNKN